MKRCLVCIHSFEKGISCPRCRSNRITSIPGFVGLEKVPEVKIYHENPELDEMLGLQAFKVRGVWFVNVNTWVDGVNQHAVVSVPIKVFKDLIHETNKETI